MACLTPLLPQRNLFKRRARILEEQRQALWKRTVGPTYRARERDGLSTIELQWIYNAWQGSASVTTVAGLNAYARGLEPRPTSDCFFCSKALRKILMALPTELA